MKNLLVLYENLNNLKLFFLINTLKYIPDLRYSKLAGQTILGLRLDAIRLLGVRFPNFKIGILTFEFPLLEHFVNLDRIRQKDWKWFGRQEIEVSPYQNKNQIVKKTGNYGEFEVLKNSKKQKGFENSYYVVYSNP